MEIGQRVVWAVGNINHKGIYIQQINEEFSQVKCIQKGDIPFICTVEVVTSLIQKDND